MSEFMMDKLLGSFGFGGLRQNSQYIVFANDQVIFTVNLDLGSGVLPKENANRPL
jgi:hypothetical protein